MGLEKNNTVATTAKSAYHIWFYHRRGNDQISREPAGLHRGEIIKLGLEGVIDTRQGRKEHKTEVSIIAYIHFPFDFLSAFIQLSITPEIIRTGKAEESRAETIP